MAGLGHALAFDGQNFCAIFTGGDDKGILPLRGAPQVERVALVARPCPGILLHQLGDTGVGAARFFGKINRIAVGDRRGGQDGAGGA